MATGERPIVWFLVRLARPTRPASMCIIDIAIGFVYIALTRRVSAGAWFSVFAGAERWRACTINHLVMYALACCALGGF